MSLFPTLAILRIFDERDKEQTTKPVILPTNRTSDTIRNQVREMNYDTPHQHT